MTSPKATVSQRFASLGWTVSGIVSPPKWRSCGGLGVNLSWLQSWNQEMDDQQGQQICATGDDEHRKITASSLKNNSSKLGDAHASNRATKSANADHRRYSAL